MKSTIWAPAHQQNDPRDSKTSKKVMKNKGEKREGNGERYKKNVNLFSPSFLFV